MFNLNFGRMKARMNANVRAIKKVFAKQNEREKVQEEQTIQHLDAPSPRRHKYRKPDRKAALTFKELIHKYHGGQFTPLKPIPSHRTDNSWSGQCHRLRLKGIEPERTRKRTLAREARKAAA